MPTNTDSWGSSSHGFINSTTVRNALGLSVDQAHAKGLIEKSIRSLGRDLWGRRERREGNLVVSSGIAMGSPVVVTHSAVD